MIIKTNNFFGIESNDLNRAIFARLTKFSPMLELKFEIASTWGDAS